jgi:CheY-like chemotaxis protein
MTESGKELVNETSEFIRISHQAARAMNEIVSGIDQIEIAVNHVTDMSVANNANFEELKQEAGKFIISAGQGKKKILLVDDDQIHLTMVEGILSDEYEVITAVSGKEALDLFFHGLVPNLILLDLVMPGMDGWHTFDRIRAISGIHDVPIAFFTASTDAKDKKHASELGAVDYIIKPFDGKDLLARAKRIVRD